MKTKYEDAIAECYRILFAKSEPPGDFDKMVEEAELDELGRKVIPYWNFEVEEGVMEGTISEMIKKYKIPKHKQTAFRSTILLGCSPKTKRNGNNT